ncbi:MAG: hypothetical protein GXO22_05730 [Aquificae bacterium]|nr:hypothetical protein [Aquificota bacterium]
MKKHIFLFLFLLIIYKAFSLDLSKQADLGDIFDNIDVDAGVSIKIFPDKWYFGAIIEDCESPAFPFMVTNDGGIPVYIKKSYIDGDDEEHFYIKEDNCKDKILAVGDACSIKVVFRPKSEGTRDAKLVVKYFGNDNLEDLIKDLLENDYKEEKADLEGVGLPSPTGDLFDYDDFCPDYPEYKIPEEIEDGGEDPDDIIGCRLSTKKDITLLLLFAVGIALFWRRKLS